MGVIDGFGFQRVESGLFLGVQNVDGCLTGLDRIGHPAQLEPRYLMGSYAEP